MPLWSAAALIVSPERVAEIHAAHADAGAELLTTNTFRTQRRTLARAGLADRTRELTLRAVALARTACDASPHAQWVLGSSAPLEDCYRPDLVPATAELAREHHAHAELLAEGGVDAIVIETLNTVREAVIAIRAAQETGVPVLASFVCGPDACLLSGETLASALEAIAGLEPTAVGINCLPVSSVDACLPVLAHSELPFAVYANLGAPTQDGGFSPRNDTPPGAFATLAAGWRRSGAAIVGGCCGTRPAHIRAIRAHFAEPAPA